MQYRLSPLILLIGAVSFTGCGGGAATSSTHDSLSDSTDCGDYQLGDRVEMDGCDMVCAPPHGGIAVDFDCDDDEIDVKSCKDLSNVVLEFDDGSHFKFDGLGVGTEATFAGEGDHAGKRIVRAWIKAGDNHSGDGPGYGERFEADCDPSDPGDPDDPQDPSDPNEPMDPPNQCPEGVQACGVDACAADHFCIDGCCIRAPE